MGEERGREEQEGRVGEQSGRVEQESSAEEQRRRAAQKSSAEEQRGERAEQMYRAIKQIRKSVPKRRNKERESIFQFLSVFMD